MRAPDIKRLLFEKVTLQRLRSELPADHVLERSGFACRLEMLDEMLAALPEASTSSEAKAPVKPR